jgi:hypothetical protein
MILAGVQRLTVAAPHGCGCLRLQRLDHSSLKRQEGAVQFSSTAGWCALVAGSEPQVSRAFTLWISSWLADLNNYLVAAWLQLNQLSWQQVQRWL